MNALVFVVVAFIVWKLLEEPAASGPCQVGVTPGCFGPPVPAGTPTPLSYATSASLQAAGAFTAGDRGANVSLQFLDDEAAALGGP
jgi:hypothetical protein